MDHGSGVTTSMSAVLANEEFDVGTALADKGQAQMRRQDSGAANVAAQIETIIRARVRRQSDLDDEENAPIPSRPEGQRRPASQSFTAIAEWEGIVSEVGSTSFSAQLVQLPRGTRLIESHPDLMAVGKPEQTELPIEDVASEDRDLLRPGGLFRMVVGYTISANGNRRRTLSVVFRRLPKWRQSEINSVRAKVEDEQALFDSARSIQN